MDKKKIKIKARHVLYSLLITQSWSFKSFLFLFTALLILAESVRYGQRICPNGITRLELPSLCNSISYDVFLQAQVISNTHTQKKNQVMTDQYRLLWTGTKKKKKNQS